MAQPTPQMSKMSFSLPSRINTFLVSSFDVTLLKFYRMYLKIKPVIITGIAATIIDFVKSLTSPLLGFSGMVTMEPSSTLG